jgi:nitroimidazol reductase NimA-like FMN-containing flavoprotein (pyridoxamine 5'-phosphate oxidase superfamily)
VSLLDRGPVLTGPVAEFVSSSRVARLATTYPGGAPHVVPISPVLDLDRIVFASDAGSQKVANIESDDRVALCFDRYAEDWSSLEQVVVHGEAYVIESGPEWRRDRDLLYEKFPQYPEESPIEEGDTVIIEVRPLRFTTTLA